VGAPQVAYRETITRSAEVDRIHKKQIGSGGEFARVGIKFEPLPPGSGLVFDSLAIDGSVPGKYLPGIESGLKSSAEGGVLVGFPVVDLKATLLGGACHNVDSTLLVFEIAARAAFKEGIPRPPRRFSNRSCGSRW
jgi:elongation factor G